MMVDARSLTRSMGGRWHGMYGMISCPAHKDRTPSCKVIDGMDRPVFHCFAGCDWRDIQTTLERAGVLQPWEPVRQSAPKKPRSKSRIKTPAFEKKTDRDDPEIVRKRTAAKWLWDGAQAPEGTLAERYLHKRAIEIDLPPSMRFHPKIRCREIDDHLPALLCAFSTLSGEFDGIQRIFLDEKTGGKAPLKANKMTYGTSPGSAIRVGEPEVPNDYNPFYGELGIAEGPEDALSAFQMFGLPVWAAGGGERAAYIDLPAPLEALTIWGDNNEPGRRFVRKIAFAHAQSVRRIDGVPCINRRYPPDQFDDVNSWLQAIKRGEISPP